MKTKIYKAESRGGANHGWLNTRHSFSFAKWFDPERISFGALRVLNDDEVAPAKGFPDHSHANMEIISIVTEGVIEHQDSLGNKLQIPAGDIQVMSTGMGVTHSEYNPSDKDVLKFFQIWIYPNKQDIEPRYDQKHFSSDDKKNKWMNIVSPNGEGIMINQDAYLSIGDFDRGIKTNYKLFNKEHGVYVFVINGSIKIDGIEMNSRDAMEVTQTENIDIEFLNKSEVLMIEVPMGEF